MKIALLGYGRMGKAIEAIALQRGHTIVIKTSQDKDYDITTADVAIDFSVPTAAYNNISNCINHNVPVISGTTGWLEKYNAIVSLCEKQKGAFIYASNFSLGVNIFFELNQYLAKMMAKLEDYKVEIEEIHHTQKLDAPSGTAITLAEGIIQNNMAYTSWDLEKAKDQQSIAIQAKRITDVPGTHTISYNSPIDTIKIEHEAHNRQGFALGAVIAAEWIFDKTGVFTMKDVLNIG
ncbi:MULTISPECIES: 4-hydroxy-tetrahydrodipicolinate reductase [unclassified Olleya]|jgi:4-hydroxy-tetrahydrodipicolinate reductase|uniref:4-hydroxy-tetrahydrodipicolinate reductase n=1 Tax=unclassified Olleya TaxID=2615019 RepID=UPI0011A15CBE|nr:4-hydroxy-tetrahydrodipicolinate reductase [Olleya sp. Hel_I_94]TVZ47154.1 dihydrodipicolinate reductase [Olleya sp. Hel_I_94]